MNKKQRVEFITQTLDSLYPKTPVPLNHKNIFQLLIAVLLSAQCTDERVNKITPELFKKAKNALSMAKLNTDLIYNIIRPCGLAPKKSKAISELSKILVKNFQGKVPENIDELEKLPGVGHKTASVVISQGFGHPAFPVDTHIHRLAQRWGLTNGRSVFQTEKDLKRHFPNESKLLFKAASGAIEHINIFEVSNINSTLKNLKSKNFWVYGFEGSSNQNFTDIEWKGNNILLFGSEGSGLHKHTQKYADFSVKINISKKIESLNVSNSVAVVLHHLSFLKKRVD